MKLFEIFDSNSVKEGRIIKICEKYKIKNYIINEDLSIDVYDNVYLASMSLVKIPLRFNNVFGDFNCNHNNLLTLDGCPIYTSGHFFCYDNSIITLKGGPKHIGENFACFNNKLKTLEGSPKYIGGIYNCSNNSLLKSFSGCTIRYGAFYCNNTPLEKIYSIIMNRDNIALFNEHDVIQDGIISLDSLGDFLLEIKSEQNIESVVKILDDWLFA